MPEIELKYGQTKLLFEYDAGRFHVLAARETSDGLCDAEIGEKLAAPVDSKTIEDTRRARRNSSYRRPRRHPANGLRADREPPCPAAYRERHRRFRHPHHFLPPASIARSPKPKKSTILTPFIAQRIKTLDHESANPAQICPRRRYLGRNSGRAEPGCSSNTIT